MPGNIDYTVLKWEILHDPTKIGYKNQPHNVIADMMNAKSAFKVKPLSTRQLLEWAAEDSRILKIKAAAESDQLPLPIRNIAFAATVLLTREDVELSPTNPNHAKLISGLIQVGVLSTKDRDELVTMSLQPACRCEQLFGDGTRVNHHDISKALREG